MHGRHAHIFTIGYGVRPLEELIETLRRGAYGPRLPSRGPDESEVREGKLYLCGTLVT